MPGRESQPAGCGASAASLAAASRFGTSDRPVEQSRTHLDDGQHVKGDSKQRQGEAQGNGAATAHLGARSFDFWWIDGDGADFVGCAHPGKLPKRASRLSVSSAKKTMKR